MSFLEETLVAEKNEYELFIEQLSKDTQAGNVKWDKDSASKYKFLESYEIIKTLRCPLKQSNRFLIIYDYNSYIYSKDELLGYYDPEDTDKRFYDKSNLEKAVRCSFVTADGDEIESFGRTEVSSGDLWRLLDYASQSAFNFNIKNLLYG